MKTTEEIKAAITRSISHTEIAKIEVEWPDESRTAEETILDWMAEIDGADDVDCVQENDGSYDVWGKLNGDDFRLRVQTAK